MELVLRYMRSVAKAIASGLVAGLTYLIGVVQVDASVGEAFRTMTFVQWAGLVIAIAAAYGITWAVPNKTATS